MRSPSRWELAFLLDLSLQEKSLVTFDEQKLRHFSLAPYSNHYLPKAASASLHILSEAGSALGAMDDFPDGEQKIFGAAGMKRKRIDFVPAATTLAEVNAAPDGLRSVGDQYLSIVLKDDADTLPSEVISHERDPRPKEDARSGDAILCGICKLPLKSTADEAATAISPTTHDLSLAHQVCVEHSYPPSHLDRRRHGLKYLSSYGWDPDARVGLGVSGDGIRAPIKAKAKNDTVGLGLKIPQAKKAVARVEMLDAGKVRKKDKEDKKRRDKLQEMLYQTEDIEKYLGGA